MTDEIDRRLLAVAVLDTQQFVREPIIPRG